MQTGIWEIDLHGMNCEQAKAAIDAGLLKAGGSVYIIRLIHGYHGGTGLRNMIREEYDYERHEKVRRISQGVNPGITELVLREL